jgi:hypothetical protein
MKGDQVAESVCTFWGGGGGGGGGGGAPQRPGPASGALGRASVSVS